MSAQLPPSSRPVAGGAQAWSAFPAVPAPVKVPLTVLPEHACPYYSDRVARVRALHAGRMDPGIYHDFMDAGFRRSGRMLYQPVCRACRDCVAIRVPVARFAAGRSQRRCWRRNLDLSVTVGRPSPTPEKHDLYARYLDARHDGQQDASPEGLEAFLYDSPVETLEFEYRDPRGALRAVGICDASERSLSSVYFYFDPAEARRGLGTFGVLQEIAFCRSVGIGHYYLGFWVAGTATMDYKAQFRPAEVLGTDGLWRPAP